MKWVVDRTLYIGNGVDEPVEEIDSNYGVFNSEKEAYEYASYWSKKGWVTYQYQADLGEQAGNVK